MDTSTTSIEGVSKKVPLEELTKEELIKKCRSLLAIAQKAKQARDALAEENHKLKEISSTNATEELLESFAQQELDLITKNDSLLKQIKKLEDENVGLIHELTQFEERLANMDTETQGYKRQVARVTEENEQLLIHLDELEMQINELKRIGLEQQEQLLVLEQNNEAIAANNTVDNVDHQIEELQKMLSVSLSEVKKLNEENNNLKLNITEKEELLLSFNEMISCNQGNIEVQNELKVTLIEKDEQLNTQAEVIDDLNTELHKYRALADKLKLDVTNTCKRLNDKQIESSGINAELQNHNEKLKEKLKSYHGKIVKLAGDVKKVRESKNYILGTFKVFSQHVQLWKEQLETVSLKMQQEAQANLEDKQNFIKRIQELEEKLFDATKQGEEHDAKSLRKYNDDLKEMKNILSENENLHKTVDIMKSQIVKLETDHTTLQSELNKIQDMDVDKVEIDMLHNNKQKLLDKTQAELQSKQNDCYNLQQELENTKHNNENVDKILYLQQTISTQTEIYQKLESDFKNLQEKYDQFNAINATLENEKCVLSKDKLALENSLNAMRKEYEHKKSSYATAEVQYKATIEGNTRLVCELKKAIEKLEIDVDSSRITESKQAEQTSAVILNLRQENKSLEDKVDELQRQFAAQPAGNANSAASLKSENAELLAEMNVMNQALKERGETISQQQAHCEELVKKIQVYEGQLAKSQENVQQLHDELQILRNQIGQQDDCDALSTSTISRADEANRMKDLDGSWEERYGKLRNYALKLKTKAKELQDDVKRVDAEKLELQGRVANNLKTVQSMQEQIDALEDKLDLHKEDKGKLDQVTKDNQTLLQQIANNEITIQKYKQQLDALSQEKMNLDAWKKEVGTKVRTLKKELEANGVMRKEYENNIQKLQTDLTVKEKELVSEREKHGVTKSQLHESNNECKKQSVLNLEMQDYERSIKELSAKVEKKNDQITKLKNQIDAQKSSVISTKEQNRLMEEKCGELETELDACRIEVRTFKKQVSDLEIAIADKEIKMDEVRKTLEATRSETEDLSTQLSKIIAEHQKANLILREEKDYFRNENVALETRARQLEDQLKLRCDELTNINCEYQSYKVRAQSVLRQNQSRDVGVEEKLTEEAASLRAQIQIYQGEIEDFRSKLKQLENINIKLTEDKVQLEASQKDIQSDLGHAQNEMDKLNSKHLQTIQEHNETVRSLKLHTETLSQCYRQQISEQEVRHNREIIELQSKHDKNPIPPTDIPSLIIPTTVREEGEGSESVDSANGNQIHPLEKLLGADQDQEITAVRKQLSDNELRVVHLTSLLADTEQDLSKHMQMNKVLKEEIRRQQRSVERERHAENLEYMKNVVFKFITLGNGDERLRLVPVLNTILKLSPEETNKLNLVAKGDKSWSTYLPLWSNVGGGSKPQ